MSKFLGYFAVFLLGFVVCAGTIYHFYGRPTMGPQEAPNLPRGGIGIATAGPNRVRDAAKIVSNYVVNIDTVRRTIRPEGGFFGFPFDEAKPYTPKGQGSGVVFTPEGYIVTNNHVVASATKLMVTLRNGRRYPAELIGRDFKTDIAVIKIDASGLNYARFADSDTLQVGDWVIAVGSPLGLESTVTVGVVSATKRGPIPVGGETLADVIQTDAAINPGNSGGALADLNGNLVGINAAMASPSGGSIGIGFAIPSNTAKNVARELIKHGKIVRPYIGITYISYNSEVRDQLEKQGLKDLPRRDGVVLRDVHQDSPAARAGLQSYDVILKVNGKPVSPSWRPEKGKATIADEVNKSKVGQRMLFEVWHAANGRITTVGVLLGEMPERFGEEQPQEQP